MNFKQLKIDGKIIKDYYIDENGNIKGPQGKFLKHRKNNRGYHMVTIYDDKQPIHILVHRAVAENFIPNPLNLPTVNHKEGDKDNNSVSGLEWSTYSDNNKHAVDHHLRIPLSCENHQNATLDNDTVENICKLLETNMTYNDIIDELNLSHINNIRVKIKMIKTLNSWRDISSKYNFPPGKNGGSKYGNNTIMEICKMLADGCRDYKHILQTIGLEDNCNTRQMISCIYTRKKYRYISDNFYWE